MLTLNVNVTFFNVNVNAPLTPPTLPRPSSTRMSRARSAAERRSEGAGLARGMRVEVGALPPTDGGGAETTKINSTRTLPEPPNPTRTPQTTSKSWRYQPNRRWGGEVKKEKNDKK